MDTRRPAVQGNGKFGTLPCSIAVAGDDDENYNSLLFHNALSVAAIILTESMCTHFTCHSNVFSASALYQTFHLVAQPPRKNFSGSQIFHNYVTSSQ